MTQMTAEAFQLFKVLHCVASFNEVGTCNGFIVIVMVACVKRWARQLQQVAIPIVLGMMTMMMELTINFL